MKHCDPARLEAAAEAMAKADGYRWAKLPTKHRAEYIRCAEAAAEGFRAFDSASRAASIKQGQARARLEGARIGGRPRVSDERAALIRGLLQAGTPIRAIREQTGAGNGAIARIKGELKHASSVGSGTRSDAGPHV
jgi:hypothetical protein